MYQPERDEKEDFDSAETESINANICVLLVFSHRYLAYIHITG